MIIYKKALPVNSIRKPYCDMEFTDLGARNA